MSDKCTWRWDPEFYSYECGAYVTDCGNEWMPVEDDGALYADVRYCQFCGRPVEPVRAECDVVCPDCGDVAWLKDDMHECSACTWTAPAEFKPERES